METPMLLTYRLEQLRGQSRVPVSNNILVQKQLEDLGSVVSDISRVQDSETAEDLLEIADEVEMNISNQLSVANPQTKKAIKGYLVKKKTAKKRIKKRKECSVDNFRNILTNRCANMDGPSARNLYRIYELIGLSYDGDQKSEIMLENKLEKYITPGVAPGMSMIKAGIQDFFENNDFGIQMANNFASKKMEKQSKCPRYYYYAYVGKDGKKHAKCIAETGRIYKKDGCHLFNF